MIPVESMPPLPWIDGGYAGLIADYPWPFKKNIGRGAHAAHYPALPVDAGTILPIALLSAPRSLLLFWTTDAHLLEGSAVRIIRGWGFEPKRLIPWLKKAKNGNLKMGVGNYVRPVTEQAILCSRGGCTARARDVRGVLIEDLVIDAVRTTHSKKPVEQYEVMERLASGPYLELFSRSGRAGWSHWGNDAPETR